MNIPTFSTQIAKVIGIRSEQAAAAISLINDGNTIPFIARYRKEATQMLDEEQLRQVEHEYNRLKALNERRTVVLASIEEQGKLTDEIRRKILAADTISALEDLYQPYKPKRRTRAGIAREKGLQSLAEMILSQLRVKESPEKIAQSYLSETVPTTEEALSGARDIAAEVISDHSEIRRIVREKTLIWGSLTSEKIDGAEDAKEVYALYYNFNLRIDRLKPYQILATNRGEEEKILRIKVVVLERDWQEAIFTYFRPDKHSPFSDQLLQALTDAADRLLLPAIDRDVRRILTERADNHAIDVFTSNLRALLLQPPLAGHVVMGIDPGFRTGCKVAVIDPTGKLLSHFTIYLHEAQKKPEDTLSLLEKAVKGCKVTLISIGNGTASRETEQLIVQLLKRFNTDLHYVITNEAGASVYSASPLAKSELPEIDVSIRGAISIARRVQDPLAELVKIEPKSIGVGLYQHDVDQTKLSGSLETVVESVVNQVGVDINTASSALLTHVSGIGLKLSEKIVAFRDANGPFVNRLQIKKIPGLGPKAFEQSAGFLRIRDGDNPLDAGAIHPESYPIAQRVIHLAGISPTMLVNERQIRIEKLKREKSLSTLAVELNVGLPTLEDIVEQLVRPGRDPRSDMPPPILRTDILKIEDLVVGLQLKGTVRNVVDFGIFVDIGVKQDGLLHRSQIPAGARYKVGDIIQVEILKVEQERDRIALKLVE